MAELTKLFLLDPNVTFLNHGSFGATPMPVFEVYQEWQRRLERQPVLFLGREFHELMQDARQVLGKYIHADANDLVYIHNATQGVNILARSLELKPGDEILTTDHEYGACDYTWDFVCKKSGATCIHQPITLPARTQGEIIEQFWQGVTEHTRVIYLSHITSPTAFRLPVEQICRRARQAGILSLVDAAHSPGQIDIDVQEIGADFVFGNCHKWMLNPKGAGFLYAKHELQHLIEPLIVSWGYNPSTESTSGSRFIDLLEWSGTRDPAAALTVPSAIQFMNEHYWQKVRSNCHWLLRQAIQRICDLTGLLPLYPLDSDYYSQMGIAPLYPSIDPRVLKIRLYDEYQIEVPIIQWRDQVFVRISVQAYNDSADIDRLLDALTRLLPNLAP